ncbi:hypothetical protein [Xanthomonas sp. SI]|nr:hypothetical protein [Xanthomonas sp. SI]QNH12235.1 hypothetical protein HEP75_01661 [Xanthomonas sp. SI]
MELVRKTTTHKDFNCHDSVEDAGIDRDADAHADANDVIEIAYAAAWKSR